MKLFKKYIDKNKQRLLVRSDNIKDSRGQVYRMLVSGAIVRVSPERPWHGKSERRAVILQRRFDRSFQVEAR